MRVCLFGNSHAAALMSGWRRIAADHPRLQLTFFAAPSGKMKGLKLVGDLLIPDNEDLAQILAMTSGGRRTVDIRDFDALVYSGMGVGEYRVSAIYQTHQPLSARPQNSRAAVISDDCLDKTIECYLTQRDTFRLMRSSRKIRPLPCFIIPDPRPTRRIELGPESNNIWRFAPMRDNIAQHFHSSLNRCAQQHDAIVIPQPAETFDAFYTKDEYGRGSQTFHLKSDHAPDEPHHMNADFGAVTLRDFANTLGV